MTVIGLNESELAEACASTLPGAGHKALIKRIAQFVPDHRVSLGLVREGWHRIGGVVTEDGDRIADNLHHWVEEQCGGVTEDLVGTYEDSGYLATKLVGKSLYFVVPVGEGPLDFIQIEVEELEEVADCFLINNEYLPDDLEDMLNPVNQRLIDKPVAISPPRYSLRRVTDVRARLEAQGTKAAVDKRFQRFIAEWQATSAAQDHRFCDHWVLTLMPYTDRFGEHRFDVKPRPTLRDNSVGIKPDETGRVGKPAPLIRRYDQKHGYPMAWYFAMVTNGGVSSEVAYAVLEELNGSYAYLPAKDLKVLRNWALDPYGL